MRTTAVRKPDKYMINSSKVFISNGGYADWYTVYARPRRTPPTAASRRPRPRDATVTVDEHEDKKSLHATNSAAISFNQTEVPAEHLLGDKNHGFELAMRPRPQPPRRRHDGHGIAERHRVRHRLLEAANPVRRTDRHAPGIQYMIADMATEIEAARLLTWRSARCSTRASATPAVAHAKRFTADTAMKVTTDAVQVYGGYGFIKDYPVEKLMRDAKIMQIYEGTSQIQRLVIAREILMPRHRRRAGRRDTAGGRGMSATDPIRAHPSTGPGGPLLICYDGSEDAKHAIERAGGLLADRPALVVTVWQPTASSRQRGLVGHDRRRGPFRRARSYGRRGRRPRGRRGRPHRVEGGARGRAARHQGHRTCLEDDHRDCRSP